MPLGWLLVLIFFGDMGVPRPCHPKVPQGSHTVPAGPWDDGNYIERTDCTCPLPGRP